MTILQEPPEVNSQTPALMHGERLDQPTFHERYEAMPPGTRAELIGGVVYIMPSPVSTEHSAPHVTIMRWLLEYDYHTPGIMIMDNATVIMDIDKEPQPDAGILILPSHGGRTTTRRIKNKTYVAGAPELLVEISASTTRLDLGVRKDDYERAGVDEYIVLLTEKRSIEWFYLVNGKYQNLQPGSDGIYRSRIFPGLWLEPEALLTDNKQRIREVIQHGLASPEHREWMTRR